MEYFFTQAVMINLEDQGEERQGIKYLDWVDEEHLKPFEELLKDATGVQPMASQFTTHLSRNNSEGCYFDT